MDKSHPLLDTICSRFSCQGFQDEQQVATFRPVTKPDAVLRPGSGPEEPYPRQVAMIPFAK